MTSSSPSLSMGLLQRSNKRPMIVCQLLVLLMLLLGATTGHAANEELSPREEIIASRQKRYDQLTSLLQRTEQMIADHHAGIKVLDDDKLTFMKNKITAYNHQLGELGRELDDEELDRILERIEEKRQRQYNDEL